LVFLVLSGGGWWTLSIARSTSDEVNAVGARDLPADRSSAEVIYLDEVLTHSVARYATSLDPVWKERYDEHVVLLDEAIADAQNFGGTVAVSAMESVADANERLVDLETQSFAAADAGDSDAATALLSGEYDTLKAEYLSAIKALKLDEEAGLDSSLSRAEDGIDRFSRAAATLLVVAVVAMGSLFGLYQRRARALRKATDSIRDEHRYLEDAVRDLDSATHALAAVTTSSATTTAHASESAVRSADIATLIHHSMQQMRETIAEIANATEQASSKATDAGALSDVARTQTSSLAASSAEIVAVLTVINDIAEQTNLLALNATIEAARAGEAGRGFSVVADEVKQLAQSTSSATASIHEIVESLAKRSSENEEAMAVLAQSVANLCELQLLVAAAIEEQRATAEVVSVNTADSSSQAAAITAALLSIDRLAAESSEQADRALKATEAVRSAADRLGAVLTA
jgi:methyl-accepting chemotaxis protein